MEVRAKHIAAIVSDYEAMCQEVLEQYTRVMAFLSATDATERLQAVQHHERIIDGMEVKLHNDIMRAIVLYNPRATDSRLIISYYDMAGNLERVGDQLLNVADYLVNTDTASRVFLALREPLGTQFEQVHSMLSTSIFAFNCGEVSTAREVLQEDNAIDGLHTKMVQLLPEALLEATPTLAEVQATLNLHGLSYCLERIGDHAANIAEATIYTYEGVFAKHNPIKS